MFYEIHFLSLIRIAAVSSAPCEVPSILPLPVLRGGLSAAEPEEGRRP